MGEGDDAGGPAEAAGALPAPRAGWVRAGAVTAAWRAGGRIRGSCVWGTGECEWCRQMGVVSEAVSEVCEAVIQWPRKNTKCAGSRSVTRPFAASCAAHIAPSTIGVKCRRVAGALKRPTTPSAR
jgi:hypothetical protein